MHSLNSVDHLEKCESPIIDCTTHMLPPRVAPEGSSVGWDALTIETRRPGGRRGNHNLLRRFGGCLFVTQHCCLFLYVFGLDTRAVTNPVVDDGTRTMATKVKFTTYRIWIYTILKSFVNRTRMTLIQWFSGKVKL